MSQLARPVGPADHASGLEDAPVTLVEYGDFECPYCGRAYPIVKAVQREVGDRLRLVYRHFPLTQIHPHAQHAAEMAEAAAEHGKFWEMHDLLFENQDALGDEDLVGYAEQLGIDPRWAASVLAEQTFTERVRATFVGGLRSGVNGTPTFFINGVRDDSGSWTDPTAFVQTLESAALAAGRMR
jgi:protein-disulfide isomerase